ncbi:hypothetical protein F25303_13931 [Fusarium sp. NRRL 25303]|nr:hypothetical protein F25303_13931 [Fusarium sp. NRRL 25303]
MASDAENWSRRNIPCVECMLFLARLEPERIRRHNLCLESPPGAARCRRCQYPETYSRCIEILRGSELACIAVNLIHAVKAFQASTDEDKNVPQLIANMQAPQSRARKAWESIREVRKLEENLDE